MAIVYIDFEASSLASGNFPIEIAWCSMDLIHGWSALIRPADGWTEWSPQSERLHGISRQRLDAEGLPAADVVTRLNADIGTTTATSDNPRFDRRWLGMLAEAGGQMTFSISMTLHVETVLRETTEKAKRPDVPPRAIQSLLQAAGVRQHHALDDCVAHALRRGAIMVEAARRGRGASAADAMSRELVTRARRLLETHGRH